MADRYLVHGNNPGVSEEANCSDDEDDSLSTSLAHVTRVEGIANDDRSLDGHRHYVPTRQERRQVRQILQRKLSTCSSTIQKYLSMSLRFERNGPQMHVVAQISPFAMRVFREWTQ